jgi:HAD superfamily hydrolase (TIGR01509 family)
MTGALESWRASRVRVMFFDAGNTLMRMDYRVLAEQITRRGVPVDAARVRAAELRARVRLDAWLARGLSTESEQTGSLYLQYLLEDVGLTEPAAVRALAEWRRHYNPPVGVWTELDPEAGAALMLLRAHGVRAAVISNSDGTVRSILTALGLGSHLEFVLDSGELGVEKPDPRIFRIALERANVEPAEAVYVGDLYSVDVLGARSVGMAGILLDPAGYWGARDCPAVRGLLEACRLVLQRDAARPGPFDAPP